MASYVNGQLVHLAVAFTSSGTPTDPTTVALKIKTPDGTETTYTYAGAQVVKDSTGNYHYDFATTQTGYHYYGFEGAGALIAASEGYFVVMSNL